MIATPMNSNQKDQTLASSGIISSNGPWHMSQHKSSKSAKENEEWPSLGTSIKKEKLTQNRVRERHSTGNSIDEKISKLKWEKLNFDITYKSKDNNQHSKGEYDKENNNDVSKSKKSRAYIKHPRGTHHDNQDYKEHKRGYNYKRYSDKTSSDYGSSRVVPNAQIISRVPVGFPYLMLYPAITKKSPTSSVNSIGNGEGKDVPSVPPACICILPPGSDPQKACIFLIRQQVQRQIEYYFTPENLAKDMFLKSNMETSSGWVPVSLIAQFKRVATLTKNIDEVTEAIAQSFVIELDSTKKNVRTRVNPEFWTLKDKLDGNDKNLAQFIKNHLVIIGTNDKKKAFTSKETDVIVTALKEYTRDMQVSSMKKIQELNLLYLQVLSSQNNSESALKNSSSVTVSSGVPAEADESPRVTENNEKQHQKYVPKQNSKLQLSLASQTQQRKQSNTFLDSKYHQSMSNNPFFASNINDDMNMQSPLVQEWFYQNFMFGNNFQVPSVASYQQSISLNNNLHAIPVIYMNADGSISYFDQNNSPYPSPYVPDFGNFTNNIQQNLSCQEKVALPHNSDSASSTSSMSIFEACTSSNLSIPNQDSIQTENNFNSPLKSEKFHIPFYYIIPQIQSAAKLFFLESFNPPNNPTMKIRELPLTIGPISYNGFLLNSLPNFIDENTSKMDSFTMSIKKFRSHPIVDFLRSRNLTFFSYHEFEKKCKESSDNQMIFDLFDFWVFFLTLNPINQLIYEFHHMINDPKYSSLNLNHYRLVLLRLYRNISQSDLIAIESLVMTDAKNYASAVGGIFLEKFKELTTKMENNSRPDLIAIVNLSIAYS